MARTTRSTCSSSAPVRSGSSRPTTAASAASRSAWSTRCPSSAARSPRCTRRRTSSTSPASRWSRARTWSRGSSSRPRPPTRRTSWAARRRPWSPTRPRASCGSGLDDGTTVVAKAVIITAGIGKFTPRPLPAAAEWDGRRGGVLRAVVRAVRRQGRRHRRRRRQRLRLGARPGAVAASVTLVHRREAFRAHQAHGRQGAGRAPSRCMTNGNVTQLVGNGRSARPSRSST